MMPDVVEALYGMKEAYLESIRLMSGTMYQKNRARFWESGRSRDFIHRFLLRQHEVEHNNDPELLDWLAQFEQDRDRAARAFWEEMKSGMDEILLDI